jgi:hypothetical protein
LVYVAAIHFITAAIPIAISRPCCTGGQGSESEAADHTGRNSSAAASVPVAVSVSRIATI